MLRGLAVSFTALSFLLCGYPATSARAQADRSSASVYTFDIPAQRLDLALARLSSVSGVQMLYDSRLAVGRRSRPVVGRYTLQEALVTMLDGTGLRARFTQGGSVVITPSATPDMTLDMLTVRATPLIGQSEPDAAALAYVSLVQREIVAAMKSDAALSGGDYRISVRMWVDGEGRVERSNLIRSSGDASRDRAFDAFLLGLRISEPPPEGLPQPMRIEFQVR
ncbi:secretin and TonB N-terminal domain-containing protein [Sphingopyxis indica]|nr:secretin and TonB N-terminal domain-containing protein [Sphingopyxis indica]